MSRYVDVTYDEVIGDVVEKVRDVFREENVDLQVLEELSRLWRYKLTTARESSLHEPFPAAYYQQGSTEPSDTTNPQSFANTPTSSDATKEPSQADGASGKSNQASFQEMMNQIQDTDASQTSDTPKETTQDVDAISSDDDENILDEAQVDNFIVCQHEKVSRTRNIWRCSLKDGMMRIDGKDLLFHKASGEWRW